MPERCSGVCVYRNAVPVMGAGTAFRRTEKSFQATFRGRGRELKLGCHR